MEPKKSKQQIEGQKKCFDEQSLSSSKEMNELETMENKGIKTKEVPQSTIASYAIHWNIISMNVHIK